MPTEVIMPALGMAQDTGTVVRWLKRAGETVSKGERLLEIETDKATVDVEAPASGTLAAVSATEGAEVQVGTVIAFVLAPGESAVGDQEPVAAGEPTAAATGQRPPAEAVAVGKSAMVAGQPVVVEPGAQRRKPRVSPKARRVAKAHGVDVSALSGSGPRGAVVAADVERAAHPPATGAKRASLGTTVETAPRHSALEGVSPQAPGPSDGHRFELPTVWRVMAERTQRAWQEVPQFVLWREVNASRLESWKAAARRKPGSDRVTHTDLLVRICAEALRRHPRVNASWREGAILPSPAINVAIAVATDDGLVAPVVHHADRLDLAAIAARRKELAEAARLRRLHPDDLRDGTFTVSNLGMYGVDGFQAIVDVPQAAILAVGRVSDRPVALDDLVVVRPVMTISASFDHRVVDGARGAEFLDTVASLVEEPAGLVA